jgi:filamentous hemagglutinin
MGGHQGGDGVMGLFGVTIAYQKGSLFDKIAESYAGTHDTLNSLLWYDINGNAQNLDGLAKSAGEASNYVNVGVATPFALSTLLPPEVWNTIMVSIQNAR